LTQQPWATGKPYSARSPNIPIEDIFRMKLKPVLNYLCAALLIAQLCFAPTTSAQAAPRRIEITARRSGFAPDELTLKKDEPVVLVLKSEDVDHGIRIKELGIDLKATKGKTSEFALTPGKTGPFVGHCSVFCGRGHGSMTLTIHVVE
jgi:cytochrome c oxidase subunit 2